MADSREDVEAADPHLPELVRQLRDGDQSWASIAAGMNKRLAALTEPDVSVTADQLERWYG